MDRVIESDSVQMVIGDITDDVQDNSVANVSIDDVENINVPDSFNSYNNHIQDERSIVTDNVEFDENYLNQMKIHFEEENRLENELENIDDDNSNSGSNESINQIIQEQHSVKESPSTLNITPNKRINKKMFKSIMSQTNSQAVITEFVDGKMVFKLNQ